KINLKMEFDNDRIRKPAYKIEIFYWIFFCLISPVVNCTTFFSDDIKTWPILVFVNLILLPAFLFYAGIVVPKLLFAKKYTYFGIVSLAFFILVQLLLFAVYALIRNLSGTEKISPYFLFNGASVTREITWTLINMFLAVAIAFIKKAEDEKDILTALEKDNLSYKLKYLRAQLNPHFLFNTLNSIYSLSLQKSDKAPEVVIKLADLMRYMIYDCEQEKIPLVNEIEFIKNYIEIEKIRFNADIKFSVEGDTAGIMIEPFLFISFIENGFKHALDNSVTRPFIYITIKAEAAQIVLNVINNSNFDIETQAKRINGKSMMNSKSLLELLYPSSYELDIIQTEKDERIKSRVRFKNARERLETLYPDSHTLDVILSNSVFTVSLILKSHFN
ncbi:MAG TPA: histidine kinase, partial [Panacibacter sp.]|nr:histidine kinase [Panacibacter sp.]